ncbi:MAG: type IX secretion system motor protein PorM/GldM [Flavobacteriales bacterium]
MAGAKLSPRQKMINMMYLVLTALLALNVSKEVLNSFFEVNLGIVKTTESLSDKNNDIYSDFTNATNQVKVKPYKDLAFQIKPESDKLVEMIQEMKYSLVLSVDKKVYLGQYLNDEGEPIEDNVTESEYTDLTPSQKKMKIAELSNKEDRDASSDLFNPENQQGAARVLDKNGNGLATQLRGNVESFRILLSNILKTAEDSSWINKGSSESLKDEIDKILKLHDNYGKKRNESWEFYNFNDMPSVAALTILSKLQTDIKNMESEVIAFLATNIDASSLKFTSAEAITIPKTNFVSKGDEFIADIFLTAKDETQTPEIYIGAYDSTLGSDGDYVYTMKDPSLEPLEVVNGKGIYKQKTSTEGEKKWRGILKMITDNGIKTFPFSGSYLVANRMAVVSPTKMNLFYLKVDNPVQVSVPGFQASDLTVSITNGTIKATKKSKGEYNVVPSKLGKSVISVYVMKDGKKVKMGFMDFRVKSVPPPIATIDKKEGGVISKNMMLASGGLVAELRDFEFEGVQFKVIAYTLTTTYQGDQVNEKVKGAQFTPKMKKVIKNTSSGSKITISDIKARRSDVKGLPARNLPPAVFTIK